MRCLGPQLGEALGFADGANWPTGAAQVVAEPAGVLLLLILVDAIDAKSVGEALARQQDAQAVALAGARCSVPAHVPILIAGCRCGERHGGAAATRNGTPPFYPPACRPTRGTSVQQFLFHGKPTPFRRRVSQRDHDKPADTLFPAHRSGTTTSQPTRCSQRLAAGPRQASRHVVPSAKASLLHRSS
jgi:hypothetical protein